MKQQENFKENVWNNTENNIENLFEVPLWPGSTLIIL